MKMLVAAVHFPVSHGAKRIREGMGFMLLHPSVAGMIGSELFVVEGFCFSCASLFGGENAFNTDVFLGKGIESFIFQSEKQIDLFQDFFVRPDADLQFLPLSNSPGVCHRVQVCVDRFGRNTVQHYRIKKGERAGVS
jgi:hypothetical protein